MGGPPDRIEIDLPNEAATRRLGRRLAALARRGDVLALNGALGSGKTALARAFITALPLPEGGAAGEEVPSPTFTLVQIYERRPAPVWHIDLYRLERPEEAEELGLEEAYGEAITLIEWPERLAGRLPAGRLEVTLSYGVEETARRAALRGGGDWAQRLTELGHDQ